MTHMKFLIFLHDIFKCLTIFPYLLFFHTFHLVNVSHNGNFIMCIYFCDKFKACNSTNYKFICSKKQKNVNKNIKTEGPRPLCIWPDEPL